MFNYTKLRQFIKKSSKTEITIQERSEDYLVSDTYIILSIPKNKANLAFNDRTIVPELPLNGETLVYTNKKYTNSTRDLSEFFIQSDDHVVFIKTNWRYDDYYLICYKDFSVFVDEKYLNLLSPNYSFNYISIPKLSQPMQILHGKIPIAVVMPIQTTEVNTPDIKF